MKHLLLLLGLLAVVGCDSVMEPSTNLRPQYNCPPPEESGGVPDPECGGGSGGESYPWYKTTAQGYCWYVQFMPDGSIFEEKRHVSRTRTFPSYSEAIDWLAKARNDVKEVNAGCWYSVGWMPTMHGSEPVPI